MSPSEKKPVSTRLATAVPGAFGAALLIGAVAFGATSLRSAAEQAAAGRAEAPTVDVEPVFGATVAQERRDSYTHDPRPKPESTKPAEEPKATENAKPAEQPKATEAAKPAEQPKVEPTAKPKPAPETTKPAPTEKPAPAPAPAQPGSLVLTGWAQETKAKLSWSPYAAGGFAYYKVVRSGDTMVTFPTSGDDVLVGAVDPSATMAGDKPSCGTPWSYAVFAVAKSNGAYLVLAASNVVTVTTACAPPPPTVEVKPIGLTVSALPGVGIQLSWEGCWREGFVAYKVVRSGSHSDPRFPLNDGTELIAAIGDPNQTGFVDTAVSAGQAWAYRVVAVMKYDGSYLPLCESAAVVGTAQ